VKQHAIFPHEKKAGFYLLEVWLGNQLNSQVQHAQRTALILININNVERARLL
jgi:hypothetical protein